MQLAGAVTQRARLRAEELWRRTSPLVPRVSRPVSIRRLLARSRRDVVVDLGSFAICALAPFLSGADLRFTNVWFDLRIVIVLLGGCLLLVRRRRPLTVALVLIVLTPVSSAIGVAASIALLGLAIRRPIQISLSVALFDWLVGAVVELLKSNLLVQPWLLRGTVFASLAFNGLIVGAGSFIQMRRTLTATRAEQLERDQLQQLQQAREKERRRIAREMHDVLGHRISLVSIYAGALEFRAATVGPEVASLAGTIRESAHQALQDLRQVVGALRTSFGDDDEPDADEPRHPQPTLLDVDRLVDESRQVGMEVDLAMDVAEPVSVPAMLGLTAYRVIQESLTNARKHAPGTKVHVAVSGSKSAGLTIDVSNGPLPTAAPVGKLPGSGYGLLGLAERAQFVGGRLEHGPTSDGGFRLAARLPWST